MLLGGSFFAKPVWTLDKQNVVRAFSQSEFLANYTRLTQYKRGQVPDCPQRIEMTAIPTIIENDLYVSHQDMRIGLTNDTVEQCVDDGQMRLISSENLIGERLTLFKKNIVENIYTSILYENLAVSLSRKKYYVSIEDTPRQCGQLWFANNETFIFFDESTVVDLTVVLKVENGVAKLLMVPLTGDIRYMIAVATGSTCIYRVDIDVSNMLNNITRPSDSPSPTVSYDAQSAFSPSDNYECLTRTDKASLVHFRGRKLCPVNPNSL